jgi:hypothetical protein
MPQDNNFDWDDKPPLATGTNVKVNVPNPNYGNDPHAGERVIAMVKPGETEGKIHDGKRVRTHDDNGNPLNTTITF